MNGKRATYHHRVVELSKPSIEGKTPFSLSFGRSGPHLRRHFHHLNRRAAHRIISKVIANILTSTEKQAPVDNDWMPKKAKECGCIQVTSDRVFFHERFEDQAIAG